jgi:hypothetical protein
MMNYRYLRIAVGDVFGWASSEAIAGASTRSVLTLARDFRRQHGEIDRIEGRTGEASHRGNPGVD